MDLASQAEVSLEEAAAGRMRTDDALFEQAFSCACDWIRHHRGTAKEFIEGLSRTCGGVARMYALDVVNRLRSEPTLLASEREYVDSLLSVENLLRTLRGKAREVGRDESSVDALFARSRAHRDSSHFIAAVEFIGRLRRYSPFNSMLIFLQRPTAKFWATGHDWEARFQRRVKENAVPLIMLQPMGPILLVYDVADTDGPPLPEDVVRAFEVVGRFGLDTLLKTIERCGRAGIEVRRRALGALHAGSAIRQGGRGATNLLIELNDNHHPAQQYVTLCHELGHVFLGHLGGDAHGDWPARCGLSRNVRELEAEAVAYLVARRAGLASTSAEYLAHYLSDGADKTRVSMDMVVAVATRVERMADDTARRRRGDIQPLPKG